MALPRNTILIAASGRAKKLCTGPKHRAGGEYIPLKRFSVHRGKYRFGKPYSRCQDCDKHERIKNWTGCHGFVLIDAPIEGTNLSVASVFQELVSRVGAGEAVRLSNLSYHPFNAVLKRKQKRVRKETFAKALETLMEVRRKDARRHPKSIKYGASARGRDERPLGNNMSSEEWRNHNQKLTRKVRGSN